jgi:hypothetical protein
VRGLPFPTKNVRIIGGSVERFGAPRQISQMLVLCDLLSIRVDVNSFPDAIALNY